MAFPHESIDMPALAPGLCRAEDGVWVAPHVEEVSYPSAGNAGCFGVEDGSFWFRHRNRCIEEAVRQFPVEGTFLDIGGGNGFVSRGLQRAGHQVVMLEPGLAGAVNARARGVQHVVRATLSGAGFRDGCVAAAGMFDVLEHIEAEQEFLAHTRRVLRPGGRLFVSVPALPMLWSDADVGAGHFRRYTAASLRRSLESAGYEVEHVSYFFSLLVLPILVQRRPAGRKAVAAPAGGNPHAAQSPFVQRCLDVVTNLECACIARRWSIPVGSSCLAVARLPARATETTRPREVAVHKRQERQ